MIDLQELKEKGKVVIRGFGVFELLPRRKGVVNCGLPKANGKLEARYTHRIKFTPSKPLKDKLCK